MKRLMIVLGALALTVTLLAACGDDDNANANGKVTPTALTNATATAGATTPAVTRPLKEVLTEAINEEYKAHATYQAVIDKLGNVAPFSNIVQSEQSHIDAWKQLFTSNSLAVPADAFLGKVTAPTTLKDACLAGVAAEKEDVAMYDRLLKETTDSSVLKVMTQQRQVSQENHLPAFEKC